MAQLSIWDRLRGMLPDYSGVAEAMPENIGKDKIMDPLVNMGMSLATLPQRALGASAEAVTSGIYNPAPALETAMLPMGTGAIAGVPVKGAEAVFGAGILRPKGPRLLETAHATVSPAEYGRPSLPPKTHDLGTHSTIDPLGVADQYAYKQVPEGTVDFMSGLKFGDPGTAASRLKPFYADVKSALTYPTDAIKWNDPGNVTGYLQTAMENGFKAPRGLLEDMHNISGSSQMWQDQFIPMLQNKGYDSLWYPHMSDRGNKKYNTIMTFEPEQLVPKFSPEGVSLAAERGVKPFMRPGDATDWRMPEGILKRPKEYETLRPRAEENTQQWWGSEAPPSKIKSIFDENTKADAELAAKVKEGKAKQEELKQFKNQYDKGEISAKDYVYAKGKLYGSTDAEMAKDLEFFTKIENPEVKQLTKQINALHNKFYGKNNTMTTEEFANTYNELTKQKLKLISGT